MEISNKEIIDAVIKLNPEQTIYVELPDEGNIDASNYNTTFYTKSISQINIDGEDLSKFVLDTSWEDVYNSIVRYKRKIAYGNWDVQLEMQFDGVWNDHVQDVKNQYPFLNQEQVNE